MRSTRLLAVVSALLIGCGGDGPAWPPGGGTDPDPTPDNWENKTPKLVVASPGTLTVGQKLEILGQDFIDTQHGYPVVVFKGTYFDDQGKSNDVDFQAKAKCVGSSDGNLTCGKLQWSLWPNIVFHPQGDRLGYFIGSIAVINMGNDGSQKPSDQLQVKLTVGPSLIPRMARPTDAGCQSVVSSTLASTPMGFAVEAVGLRPASQDNPIKFYWTFLGKNWKVSTSHELLNTDPESIYGNAQAFMFEDTVTDGATSTVRDHGDRNFFLKIGSDIIGQRHIKILKTEAVPDGVSDGYHSTVNVAAVDASGKSVQLSIPLKVFPMATMHYDGNQEIAQRFEPVPVTDCISGGQIGTQVSYSEDKAETRSRSMSFQYNANAGVQIAPWPANPWALGINFSIGFGVDVGASVSSSKSTGMNVSGQILPGEYGVFYRQTTQILRVGRIIGHTACGQTADLGEAFLTDWMFTPELSTGSKCMPKSNLPPAQKFIDIPGPQ